MNLSVLDNTKIYGTRGHKALACCAAVLALLEVTRILGFVTVTISYGVLVPLMLLSVVLGCSHAHVNIDKGFLTLLLYIPAGILITNPPAIFQPWQRYSLFAVLMLCVSPFLSNSALRRFRFRCFKLFMQICTPLSAFSLFCYFLGINYFRRENGSDSIIAVGRFSAIFNHSMILGPVSALCACATFWLYLKKRNYIFLAFAVCCIGATMFSASRAALFGGLLGCLVIVYFNSRDKSKNVRMLLMLAIIGICSFPLWSSALEGIEAKNEVNERLGEYGSRTSKFEARFSEIESSPVFGMGFASIDIHGTDGYDPKTGVIEPGSSWLGVLSMTGIIGFVIVLSIMIRTFRILIRSDLPLASLMLGLLSFVCFHCIFEGYLFAGGSVLCFISWLIIGVSNDIKYAKQ